MVDDELVIHEPCHAATRRTQPIFSTPVLHALPPNLFSRAFFWSRPQPRRIRRSTIVVSISIKMIPRAGVVGRGTTALPPSRFDDRAFPAFRAMIERDIVTWLL